MRRLLVVIPTIWQGFSAVAVKEKGGFQGNPQLL
jgi:hypothetical protein